MRKRLTLFIVLLAGASGTAGAQANAQKGNLPVAIVMVDELPFKTATAVLIRRKDLRPQDIVLVSLQTSPGDLSRAMSALARSRRSKGGVITDNMVAPIAPGKSTTRSKDYAQAQKDLASLRTTLPHFIEGVGSRPVIYSHLRPAAGNGGK
jgi:hypothetical protein